MYSAIVWSTSFCLRQYDWVQCYLFLNLKKNMNMIMNMNFEHDHISFMSLLAHQQKRWVGGRRRGTFLHIFLRNKFFKYLKISACSKLKIIFGHGLSCLIQSTRMVFSVWDHDDHRWSQISHLLHRRINLRINKQAIKLNIELSSSWTLYLTTSLRIIKKYQY